VTPTLRARLDLLGAAALFSTGGAVIKSIDLNAWQVASFRSAVAAIALLVFLPAARRLANPRAWLVGLGFAITMLLYVAANKHTTALNSIFLQATAPIYVFLLSPLLLREHANRRDLLFMGAIGGGMSLLFFGHGPPLSSAPDPLKGNVFAACSGLTWALTILGLRWLSRGTDAGATTAAVSAGSILAAAMALPFALPVASITPADASLISYLGIFQIALAYVFLTRGIRRVAAFETSLLLLVEPVLNPVWAFLVHGEFPPLAAAIGCVLILSATVGKAWLESMRVNRR